MTQEFERSMVKVMAVSGVAIIPVGLVLSAVLAGWKGFLGGLAGFVIACINTVAVIFILRWAVKKPVQMLAAILSGSYFARLLALVGVLYGMTRLDALNAIAMLSCFLALYLAHTTMEMVLAWRSLGMVSKAGDPRS